MARNNIAATVYLLNGQPYHFENVHFISFVNEETFGEPKLIAEDWVKAEGMPVRILYVNPQNIAVVEAVRDT